MSNVINFLETLGSTPALSPAEYAATVAMLDADIAQRQALLDRDHAALSELLDGRAKMLFAICTPDEEQPIPDDDEDGDDVPDQDEPTPERQ